MDFGERHLCLMEAARIKPMVNQIEYHPKLQQGALCDYCASEGILVEAWSPIMKGQVMSMSLLNKLRIKYGKTPAQVALRWHLEQGRIVIPKTVTQSRLVENMAIFDFELTKSDIELIGQLDEGVRIGADPDDIFENGYNPS